MAKIRVIIKAQYSRATYRNNECFDHCKLLDPCLDIPGVSICNTAKRRFRKSNIYISNFIVLRCEKRYG